MQTDSLYLDLRFKETDNDDNAQVEIKYITIDSTDGVIGSIVEVCLFVPALGDYVDMMGQLMNDDSYRHVWDKINAEFDRYIEFCNRTKIESEADKSFETYRDMKEEWAYGE